MSGSRKFGSRPTPSILLAALSTLLFLSATLLVDTGTARAASSEAVEDPPVAVLVHGWRGTAESFAPMTAALADHGIDSRALTLPGDENRANAQAVADAVDEVRAEFPGRPVALVTHSMGGLSARHYLKFLGGDEVVADYIAMGTSQSGYWPACLLPEDGGGQMCPTNPFLAELNAGDDTPGPVRYTALRSTEDESDGALDGGYCAVPPVDGVPHADEPGDPEFARLVTQSLLEGCPGEYVDLPIE
ncbi:alpha/beta fold hydrolase [Rhodococcus triatomae]|uniref:Triacylglycerol lipase n=1 Tax=Rhodococcus triatomae TaxID=300028 RepID=A0A1G8LXR4_9NOCA|nr:alpha/beta fold hydrolase [Rhodococcus triatomae]QNG18248.1 alpha/beta fold hydrolase [Rhodococcus triatomae]QNG22081.1 alpha/beta fold hydrolase [Rhodococcus triatomae]SDI60436.1 triacylglycerol lipase [Rhodococcus triatomae]